MTSQTSDMQAILERLSRLERQNRNLKLVGAAVLVAFGSLAFMGQNRPQSRTLEAQHFVLKNESGAVRGRWDANAVGSTFALFDQHQKDRVQLGLNLQDVGGLVFWDAQQNPVVQLGLDSNPQLPQGHPALLLYGSPGQPPTVELRALPLGSTLTLRSPDLEAFLAASGDAGFLSFGKPGPIGPSFSNVWLHTSPDGSLLNVRDAKGFSATIGSADLETPSQGGTSHTSAASLILFNDKGNAFWRAPY